MLILLNKPFEVICQFSPHPTRPTLASHVPLTGIYPAGRLDADSEGLVLLTDDGKLQHAIADPRHKQTKTYLVQVEGEVSREQLDRMEQGLDLGDFTTAPCHASKVLEPGWLWPRDPPVRQRANQPTSWLVVRLTEGKNRQVRRMTAAVGLPTLRLVRVAIGPFSLETNPLLPGEWQEVSPAALQAALQPTSQPDRQ